MQSRRQIQTDERGNITSVTVPYDEWLKLQARVKRLENKLRVVTEIRRGVKEVNQAASSGRKLQSLSDFINESRG